MELAPWVRICREITIQTCDVRAQQSLTFGRLIPPVCGTPENAEMNLNIELDIIAYLQKPWNPSNCFS